MGRKSLLTDRQWNEIQQRIIDGEKIRVVAREFKIAESAIRKKLSENITQIKSVAQQIVSTERSLSALPASSQLMAQNLAYKLKSISDNLANSSYYHAINSSKLAELANSKLNFIIENGMDRDYDSLREIGLLTSMSNESSKVPISALSLNKDSIKIDNESKIMNIKEISDDELFSIITEGRK